jgi:hypothetical protein
MQPALDMLIRLIVMVVTGGRRTAAKDTRLVLLRIPAPLFGLGSVVYFRSFANEQHLSVDDIPIVVALLALYFRPKSPALAATGIASMT